MKIAMILVSMLFAGSVFAQEGAAPAAPATGGDQMAAPADAGAKPAKKEHKKKGHKKSKKAEGNM